MQTSNIEYRLLAWGGAALLAVGIVLRVWGFLSPHDDPAKRVAVSIARESATLISVLRAEAAVLTNDTRLTRWAFLNEPDSLSRVFLALRERAQGTERTLELLDARGNILAWSGRAWLADRSNGSIEAIRQSTRLIRSGLFVIMSVTATGDSGNTFVRVTVPVVCTNNILAGLSDGLWLPSREPGTKGLRLLVAGEVQAADEAYEGLFDESGKVIGGLAWPARPADAAGANPFEQPSSLLVLAGFVALLPWRWRDRAWVSIAIIGSLWIARYAALLLEVPGSMDLGSFTDPVVFASPFGGGLAATPLDLLFSAFVLLASTRLLNHAIPEALREGPLTLNPVFAVGELLAIPVLLLFASRAYAASISSIIVDSTVQFYEPAAVIPTVGGMILILSALIFGWILIVLWVGSVRMLLRASITLGFESAVFRWGIVSVVVLLAAGAYSIVDTSGVLSPWLPLFMLIATGSISPAVRPVRSSVVGILAMVVMLIVLTIGSLDRHAALHRKDVIRHRVEEGLNPGDAWLTFLMQTDLASMATDPVAYKNLRSPEGSEVGGTAFEIWTHSVMSRQTANSGVVLYDLSGREIDRFVIGFSTYEQDVVLRALFDGAEEKVHVITGSDIAGGNPVYGGWATMRDSLDRPYGTIATLLTPSTERPLYWAVNDANEPPAPSWRQAVIVDSLIVRSDLRTFRTGASVDSASLAPLARVRGPWAWIRDERAGGEILWMRDPSDADRLVATLVEDQDVRWRMFHAANVLFVCLLVAGVFGSVRLAGSLLTGRKVVVSFRAKLFAMFALLATGPLLLLAYYNKTTSEERAESEITATLERHGADISRRMEELFQFESDLDEGVNDDFCASLASELGVEFSVYLQELVSASSRPEMFTSGILDTRLSGDVFARVTLMNEHMVIERQPIGDGTYAVGYVPWYVMGKRAGILAIPTLFRQQQIERDLIERNAFMFVAYGFAVALTLVFGWYASERLTRPLTSLREASESVAKGEKVPPFNTRRGDELGTLMKAFDHMVGEIERSKELLSRMEREQAWREMAKQVAHEIKNPLTPMKLSVQQLKRSFKDKARNREETLYTVAETLLEQIDVLSRIASEFSHFARLPHGRFEKADVIRVARETLALFGSIPGVSVRADLPQVSALVICDVDEVRRVFVNLLRNSVQALDGKGTIRCEGALTDGRLTILISDSGPGVPEHMRDRIFEPNFSTKTEGMGLGLAISRRIVEDLGGSLTLEPASGGACFRVSFPLTA